MTCAAIIFCAILHTAANAYVTYPTNALGAAESRALDTRYVPGNPTNDAVLRVTVSNSLPALVGTTDAWCERLVCGSLFGLPGQTVLDVTSPSTSVQRVLSPELIRTNAAPWRGTGVWEDIDASHDFAALGSRLDGRILSLANEAAIDVATACVFGRYDGVMPIYGPVSGQGALAWRYRRDDGPLWASSHPALDPGGPEEQDGWNAYSEMALAAVGGDYARGWQPMSAWPCGFPGELDERSRAPTQRLSRVGAVLRDAVPRRYGDWAYAVEVDRDFPADEQGVAGVERLLAKSPLDFGGPINTIADVVNAVAGRDASATNYPPYTTRLSWWWWACGNALLSLPDVRLGFQSDGPDILVRTVEDRADQHIAISYPSASFGWSLDYAGRPVVGDVDLGSPEWTSNRVTRGRAAWTNVSDQVQYRVDGDPGVPVISVDASDAIGDIRLNRDDLEDVLGDLCVDAATFEVSANVLAGDVILTFARTWPEPGRAERSVPVEYIVPNPVTNVWGFVENHAWGECTHLLGTVPFGYTLSNAAASMPRRYPAACLVGDYAPTQTVAVALGTYVGLDDATEEERAKRVDYEWEFLLRTADFTASRDIDDYVAGCVSGDLADMCVRQCRAYSSLPGVSIDALVSMFPSVAEVEDFLTSTSCVYTATFGCALSVEELWVDMSDPETGARFFAIGPTYDFEEVTETPLKFAGVSFVVTGESMGRFDPHPYRSCRSVGRYSLMSMTRWPWRAMRRTPDPD